MVQAQRACIDTVNLHVLVSTCIKRSFVLVMMSYGNDLKSIVQKICQTARSQLAYCPVIRSSPLRYLLLLLLYSCIQLPCCSRS